MQRDLNDSPSDMDRLDFAQGFLPDDTHLLLSMVDSSRDSGQITTFPHPSEGHDQSRPMYNLRPRSNSPNGEELPYKASNEEPSPSTPRNKRSRVSLKKRLMVNARERERMKILNKGFQALRDALPCYIADGHMAKITTLRLAINYIKALSEVLSEDPPYPVHSKKQATRPVEQPGKNKHESTNGESEVGE